MQKSLAELSKAGGGGEGLESLKKEIRQAKEKFWKKRMDAFDKTYLQDLDAQRESEKNPPLIQRRHALAIVVVAAGAAAAYMYMRRR